MRRAAAPFESAEDPQAARECAIRNFADESSASVAGEYAENICGYSSRIEQPPRALNRKSYDVVVSAGR